MPVITCPNCGDRTPATETDPVCGTCCEPIPADFIRFDTGVRPVRGLGSPRRIRPSGMRLGPKITALIVGFGIIVGIIVVGMFIIRWLPAKKDPQVQVAVQKSFVSEDRRFHIDYLKIDPTVRSFDVVRYEGFAPVTRTSLQWISTYEEFG